MPSSPPAWPEPPWHAHDLVTSTWGWCHRRVFLEVAANAGAVGIGGELAHLDLTLFEVAAQFSVAAHEGEDPCVFRCESADE